MRRKEKKERRRERAKGQSQRNSRAESCPHVDVNSDINAARQRDTREKSRLGWDIICHTSLETNFDRKEGVVSVVRDRLNTYDEGISFAKSVSHNCVEKQPVILTRRCIN